MISATVIEALKEIVPTERILFQEPMKLHTTFRIGGPADCLIYLENEDQLCRIQKYLRLVDVPYTVIGNGSNLLVDDGGYRGIVLVIGKYMSRIEVKDTCLEAEAGALMSQVAKIAKENGLTGLEFAAGIPGTVGGGAVMNAGAYGGEMSQVVTTVTVVNRNGEIMELDNSTMEYGYRTSVIQNQPFVVTKVTFRLQPGDPQEIAAKMEELAIRRREKQPLEYPSAGSTFKRPEGHFAGQLIMEAGLRGYSVGGAKVSDKHCGFIINTGNATAEDVKDVIWEVQRRVKERFHVDLEPEIKML